MVAPSIYCWYLDSPRIWNSLLHSSRECSFTWVSLLVRTSLLVESEELERQSESGLSAVMENDRCRSHGSQSINPRKSCHKNKRGRGVHPNGLGDKMSNFFMTICHATGASPLKFLARRLESSTPWLHGFRRVKNIHASHSPTRASYCRSTG